MTSTDDTQRIPLRAMTSDLRCPHLVVINGESVGMTFDLSRAESVIGRDLSADIRLTGASVSRRHAVVRAHGSSITIEDLGSRNGTFVNMEQVKEPRPLKDDDLVSIGYANLLRVTYAVSADAAVRRAGFEHATRDPETLVANTLQLTDRLRGDLAYARRHGQPLTLIFFRAVRRRIEEAPPRSPIDHTLRDIAKLIRHAMRADELLARAWGSDLVAIVRSDESQASSMAARVKVRAAESKTPAAGALSGGILLAAAIVPIESTEPVEPEIVLSVAHQRAREIFGQGASDEETTARMSAPTPSRGGSNGDAL